MIEIIMCFVFFAAWTKTGDSMLAIACALCAIASNIETLAEKIKKGGVK